MSYKESFFLLFTITILALGTLIIFIFNADPFQSTWVFLSLFFLCFFLSLLGIFTFLGFGVRTLLRSGQVIYSDFRISLRQSILFSAGVVLILILQALKVLGLIELIIIILVVILLELFFKAR